MRALVAVVTASLLSSCTATLLFQPQVLVSPYYTKYQLRGATAVQSDPGGGNPPVDNPPQTMRTFGQDHHRDDYGVRADVGDGFAGLRVDYFHLDQDSASPGTLENGGAWGALQPNDVVRMHAEMNEVRLGFPGRAVEDLEQACLERHLDQACRKTVLLDLEEFARRPVSGHDVALGIQQERHHGRALEQRAKRITLRDAPFGLLFVAASVPDHGRSI